MKAKISYQSGMAFDVEIRDHHLKMDTQTSAGGQNSGPTPKELLLAGIVGCAGMDVVSLLKKHKMTVDSLSATAEGETRKEHPRIFNEVLATFEATGSQVGAVELLDAVKLSMTRYCGVSAMVSKASPIRYRVLLNHEVIGEGMAEFL